jgi:hypothetical protein
MQPPDLQGKNLLVLAWTDHFFGDAYLDDLSVDTPGGRPITLTFTRDRERLPEADAVWFHGPHVRDLPRKSPGQPWILMSMESDVNYPGLRAPHTRVMFDLLMTYRLDSDIPCIYPNWSEYGSFLEPPPARDGGRGGALACYIASNPVAYRDEYAAALMEEIPIDSPGRCLNNITIQDFVTGDAIWQRGGWASVLEVLPRYKFYLAFENSRTTDYVTERIFHALVVGTVPVYLGAPNVRDFMPADDAVIVASEYESPAALAAYLRHLDANDEAYARHLAWKREGLSHAFRNLVDMGSVEPRVRLATKLAHGCDRSCRCGGRRREPGALP